MHREGRKIPGPSHAHPRRAVVLCAVISLVVGSVCVAIAFPIATGKHIGDCDLVPSTSASCTPALEADEVRTRQAYREGLGVL